MNSLEKYIENNTKLHGGKREGAGRKPKDTTQLSLKVPIKLIKALNEKYPTVKERNIEVIKMLEKLTK